MGSGLGLDGCHACIKYLMFAFNLVFWLIGCALVGVGIWVLVDEDFGKLVNEGSAKFQFLQYGGITLIVIGGIIMVVGFFGCCGAIRESQCCLTIFFIFMLVLFIALVAAGVAVLVFKDEVTDAVVEEFDKQVKNYDGKNEFVDLVQNFFMCCGTNGRLDYDGIKGLVSGKVPESCSKAPLLNEGCAKIVPEKLSETVTVAAGIALGAGAVMLIGMIFSMVLCCAIRDM